MSILQICRFRSPQVFPRSSTVCLSVKRPGSAFKIKLAYKTKYVDQCGQTLLFSDRENACNRLNHRHLSMERMMGIEPTTLAWEAKVLPLNYIRTTLLIALPIWNVIIISLFITNVKQNYVTRIALCHTDRRIKLLRYSPSPAVTPQASRRRQLCRQLQHCDHFDLAQRAFWKRLDSDA